MQLRLKFARMALVACFLGAALLSTAAVDPAGAQTPNMRTKLDKVTFVAFDTETTGFGPTKERVVEIGAVKYENGQIVAAKTWLLNPGKHIPARVAQVHGITDEMVKNQPTFAEVYPEFEAFIGNAVLLAHNARFDVDFMREELKRINHPMPENMVIDSLKLFRRWYPEQKSHRISTLAEYLQINGEEFHRAEADSAYLIAILLKGMESNPKVDTLRELFVDAGGALVF